MDLPEIHEAIRLGRLKPDGKILKETSQLVITKAAIDPVWYLPGVAKRFNTSESNLRQQIFQETNGMYPELVTRTDLKVFLPPIGGCVCSLSCLPSAWIDANVVSLGSCVASRSTSSAT